MPFLLFMPSFNQAHYIVDAVRSVLAQDDPDWELWIVDNSTDNTPQVMQQFDDSRIRFHHIAARMDPGTCLNWMLDRAVGSVFSYIHTDNNLQPGYVRRMREAIAGHPFGLAYCDMRTIDKEGRYFQVHRRGKFNLPRLLSVDPLGVPFAATTELARQLGGFGTRDFADDVRFCASAFGIAHYVHIDEPLLDYRNHDNSRTTEAGGNNEMQKLFVDLMPKILPTLQKRGLQPLSVMAESIKAGLDAMDLYIEDLWYQRLGRHALPWWEGYPKMDHFFWAGLLPMPGFSKKFHPKRRIYIHSSKGKMIASPWAILKLRHSLFKRKRELRYKSERVGRLLITWAAMTLNVTSKDQVSFRVRSVDVRTLWAARHLQLTLGWQPLLDYDGSRPTAWLGWSRSEDGREPLLDCSAKVYLSANDIKTA